jgi:hypothetical protein
VKFTIGYISGVEQFSQMVSSIVGGTLSIFATDIFEKIVSDD